MKKIYLILIVLLLLGSADLFAFRLYSVRGRIGVSFPEEESFENGILFGGTATFNLPVNRLYLDTDLNYVSWEHENNSDYTFRDIALTTGVKYLLPIQAPMQFYVGTGAGIHFMKAEVGDHGDSESEFGFYFMGGMSFPVARKWSLDGSFRYDLPTDDNNNYGTFALAFLYTI